MPNAQSGWSRSDYKKRLLIALYQHHNTSTCVDEMFCTAVMDDLYKEFVELTRLPLTRTDVYSELRELEAAGLFGVVSLCVNCKRLRCNVKADRCPLCVDRSRRARHSYLPPLFEPGSHGVGGTQVGWHSNRKDEPSPWQENAIGDMEDP